MPEKKSPFHENFDRNDKVKLISEKSFGLTFAVVFLLLAILPILFQHPIRLWSLMISLIFYIVTFLSPKLLKPLSLYWLNFGLLLNKIISPVVLLLLYYLAFVPTGLLLKLLKKDILKLKINKLSDSYWNKSDAQISSMKDQF